MASNEDILMQFKAKDNVSSVVKTMEANVKASMEAIRAASSDLDKGVDNLSKTSENVSKAFDNIKNNSINIDDSDVKSTEKEVDNLKKDDVKLKVNSDDSEVDSLQLKLTKLKQNKIQMDLEANTAKLDQVNTKIANIQKAFKSLENPVLEPEYKEEQIKKLQSTLESLEKEKINLEVKVANDELKKAKELEKELNYTAKLQLDVDGDEELSDVKSQIKNIEDDEIDIHVNNMAAMAAVDQIGEGFDRLKQGAGELGEQFGSILESAGKQETNKTFLQQAVGDADVAKQKLEDINGVVQALPGDDSVLQGLLGQAVAKDASLTTDELQKMGGAAADYFAAMENFGKNSTEAFQDMNNYLMTGMTAEIERSPILANHIDKLKEANTIQERSQLLQEALNEEHWGGISQQDTYNNKLQTFEGMLERGRYNLGGLFQEGAKGGMEFVMQLDDATGGLVGMGIALAGMASPLTDTIMGLGQIATGIKSIQDLGFVDFLKDVASAKKAGDTASAVGSVGDVVDDIPSMNTGGIAKGSTEVVKDASTVGALAPEAEAAAAGTTATGGAMSGIATAFTSMIVPLLAISAVVAVMIPIIAGLAAEALIFIKGIQLLIDALDFDKIDLTGAIEGIKQIGRAMLELGIAMGEMTFAGIMTSVGVLISGITGLINPVQVAGNMLLQAAKELEIFNTVNIDPSINKKITSISVSLRMVSAAMTNLTKVAVTMALGNLATLGGLLGNVSQAITTAKNEITHAAKEIAKLKNLPNIDKGAVERLKKVSSSLKSVATAMEALRNLRDSNNFDLSGFIGGLFGGVDIQQAISNVKKDIYKAASALSVFKDMPSVPKGVSKKLKSVASALKSVAKSMESLRELRDNYNWDSAMGNIFQGVDIPTVINNLRGTLYKVAASLRSLNGISAIPKGTAGKIKKVTSTTKTIIKSIDTLKDLNSSVTGTVNLDNVVKNVDSAKKVIRKVASRLRSLSTIANVPEGVGAKIKTISSTTKSLKGSITAMNNVPQVNDGTAERVKKAVSSVKKVAKQLNRLENTNVSGGIGQILQSVNDALSQLKTSLSSASGGFKSSGVSIGNNIRSGIKQGMSNLSGTVRNRVSSATGSGASAARTGGASMGNSATSGFRSAFKIADIASSEVSFATQAIQNGTSAFVQAVGSMAEQAVQEAKSKLDQQSPGKIARMWGDEMSYSKQLVLNKGQGLVSGIRDITSGAVNAGQGSINMGSAFTTDFDYARLNAVNTMGQGSNMGSSNGSVTINFAEGAVKLDAHNMTTKECRQIMINAMDGLSDGNYRIDVKGA